MTTIMLTAATIMACGHSYQQTKELSRMERKRLAREDSMALKVAVMPSLDCLPLYIAEREWWTARKYGVGRQKDTAR